MASGQDSNIRFTAVGLTDVGQVREHNEDNFLVVDLAADRRGSAGEALSGDLKQRGISLVVADGMGGAAAGEVASQMAVDILGEEFRNADLGGTVRSEPDVIGLLETAIHKANDAIFKKGQENKDQQGMGTTLTASVILGDSLYLSQVGDSRGYILRKGKLVQMTRDQSLIGQLIEEGTLTEEQAEKLGGKNIILQALGVEETLKIDSKRYEILQGDILLLCSDGLTGMVPDKDIERILNEEHDLPKAAKRLIDAANAGGGKDNITLILGRFEGAGLREPLTPLSDADKAGGTFRAPPPPKSKAGQNAIIATAGILLIVLLYILWPKPKLVTFKVNNLSGEPIPFTILIKGTPEGGNPAYEQKVEASEPGGREVELPEKQRFTVSVTSPGYREFEEAIDTDVEHNRWLKEYVLALIPAKSLKVLPPDHGGRPLAGVKVTLIPENSRVSTPKILEEVNDGPRPDFDEFPAGRWKAVAERRGFAKGEDQPFEVKSGEAARVKLEPLKELFGSVLVTNAPEGATIQILDGGEALLESPVTVNVTRSAVLEKVRATRVRVRVIREGYEFPEQAVEVEEGRQASHDLSSVPARISFVAPGGKNGFVNLSLKGGTTSKPMRLDNGKTGETTFAPGTYEVKVSGAGLSSIPAADIILEPGQRRLNVDVEKLGQ